MANLKVIGGLDVIDQLSATFVTGDIVAWHGTSSVPNGWLLCDGSEYLQSLYPDLYAIIANKYGTITGLSISTTAGYFRLPRLNTTDSTPTFIAYDGSAVDQNGGSASRSSHTHSITSGNIATSNAVALASWDSGGHTHADSSNLLFNSDTDVHEHSTISIGHNAANNTGNFTRSSATRAIASSNHLHSVNVSGAGYTANYVHTHTTQNSSTSTGYTGSTATHTHTTSSLTYSLAAATSNPPHLTTRYIIKV